jgi:hypothetical protein
MAWHSVAPVLWAMWEWELLCHKMMMPMKWQWHLVLLLVQFVLMVPLCILKSRSRSLLLSLWCCLGRFPM